MRITILVLLLAFATGCATTVAELDMPAESLAVSGANPRAWNEPIAFGPWRTEIVNEGTRRSMLIDLRVLSAGRMEQGSRLRIAGVNAECHTRELLLGRENTYIDPTLGQAALLVCGFDRGGDRSVLTLSRTGKTDAWLTGEVRNTEGPLYEIRSLHQAKGSRLKSDQTLGFEILSRGARVAVVETMNRGRVWISPEVKNQEALVAIAASLLLFRDPDGEFMENF